MRFYERLTQAVLRRPVELGQYLSIRYTERLAEAGMDPSVGSVGDSYDNALAESVIGLFKTVGHPEKGALAWPRGRRVCDAPLGFLVQHATTLGTDRVRSPGRVRGALLSEPTDSRRGGGNQLNRSPENPGRFTWSVVRA
jgi:hypothetical protein